MATILTVAFAFGSAVYAFSNRYLLIVVVIVFYLILQRLLDWHRKQKYSGQAVIYHHGQAYRLNAYMDSGNTLVDPQTKSPVNMISLAVFLQMFPHITAEQILCQELDQALGRGHYLECNTVNGKGKIFVFSPDKMKLNGTTVANCLLGVSPKHFGSTKYDALLNVKLGGWL